MLDVHPPEHPAHSWSDFFIHMATICLGLLIAIGLEQTVEWFHMRHRVSETRDALARELSVNQKSYLANVAAFRYNTAAMRNNLDLLLFLRAHPKAAEGDLPGVLVLRATHMPAAVSGWDAAKQTGIVDHLPLNEVTETDLMYTALKASDAMEGDYWDCVNRAARFGLVDPNVTHLSSEQLDKEILTMEECADINHRMGTQLQNLASFRPDFTGGPSHEELMAAYIPDTPDTANALAAAKARTATKLEPLQKKMSDSLAAAFEDYSASAKH